MSEQKRGRGRKPKFNPERIAKICDAIANGHSLNDAAKIGGITYGTLWEWMQDKKDFSDAIQKAQTEYENWQSNEILNDAKKSLKTLINGLEYEEVKTEYESGKDGKPKVKKQTRITKRIMPNATAVIFALCNRDPEHWQNRISQDVNGKLDVEQKGSGVSLANVPDSLLAQVIDAINGK